MLDCLGAVCQQVSEYDALAYMDKPPEAWPTGSAPSSNGAAAPGSPTPNPNHSHAGPVVPAEATPAAPPAEVQGPVSSRGAAEAPGEPDLPAPKPPGPLQHVQEQVSAPQPSSDSPRPSHPTEGGLSDAPGTASSRPVGSRGESFPNTPGTASGRRGGAVREVGPAGIGLRAPASSGEAGVLEEAALRQAPAWLALDEVYFALAGNEQPVFRLRPGQPAWLAWEVRI